MLDFSLLRIGASVLLSLAAWPVTSFGYWIKFLDSDSRFDSETFTWLTYHVLLLIVWTVAALLTCLKLGIPLP